MSIVTWATLSLFAPLAAAVLLAVLPALRRRALVAQSLSVVAAGTSLLAALVALLLVRNASLSETVVPWIVSDGRTFATVGVHVDGISATMLSVVAFVALCVQLFSMEYLRDEPEPALGRYFGYQSLFLFSMQLLVVAPNLLQLFAGWELVGATSYLLIGYWYRKPSAARAAVKAFWITKFADMGLLVGLVMLFNRTGSFDWNASLATGPATSITLLLVLAVMGKSAQFPLHVWLPDAMEGPTPVSALLHAATMVAAGVYLVVRAGPLFQFAPFTQNVLAYVGSITALFGAIVALVQNDLKKVLAYSTCSQLGYMLAALGAGSTFAGFFHLTTHAFFKALLFLAAGSVIHAVGSNDMSRMGGLARKMPITATVFVIGALALAGIPGFSGFFSKDLVLESVAERSLWLPEIALVSAVFLTALYMGRAVLLTFFGAATESAEHAHEPGLRMKIPLLLLAVPAIVAGFFGTTLASTTHFEYAFSFGGLGGMATVFALAGLSLAGVFWGRSRIDPEPIQALGVFVRGAWIDRAYVVVYRRGLLFVAAIAAWIDRYIVDALVNVVGSAFLLLARRARTLQTGNVQDYLYAVSLGVIALAAWSLWR